MLRHVDREQSFVFAEPVEGPQGGDLQINAFAAQLLWSALGRANERALPFVLEKFHQVRKPDGLPLSDPLAIGPIHEPAQQRGISFLGVFGLAAFVAEVLQEVLDQVVHGDAFDNRMSPPRRD